MIFFLNKYQRQKINKDLQYFNKCLNTSDTDTNILQKAKTMLNSKKKDLAYLQLCFEHLYSVKFNNLKLKTVKY